MQATYHNTKGHPTISPFGSALYQHSEVDLLVFAVLCAKKSDDRLVSRSGAPLLVLLLFTGTRPDTHSTAVHERDV